MQNSAHVIAFYSHKARVLMLSSRFKMSELAVLTRAHDAYLIAHDQSVSTYVNANSRE